MDYYENRPGLVAEVTALSWHRDTMAIGYVGVRNGAIPTRAKLGCLAVRWRKFVSFARRAACIV